MFCIKLNVFGCYNGHNRSCFERLGEEGVEGVRRIELPQKCKKEERKKTKGRVGIPEIRNGKKS